MHRAPKSLPILLSTLIDVEDNFRGMKEIWNFKLIKLELNDSGLSQPLTKCWKWRTGRRLVSDLTNTECKDDT